jgi:DNA-binding HxlR family transcriptional regulator
MKHEKKTKPVRRSDCAVACALDIIGDRWTLLVVRDLLRGKRHFDDFLRSPEGIATNILSAGCARCASRAWSKKR